MSFPTIRNACSGGRHDAGFTLIELMIVCAVIAILAAVAYPSYRDSVLKGKRAEARTALTDLLQQQERYMTQNNTYKTFATTDAGLPFKTYVGQNTSTSTYNLSATTCNATATARDCIKVVATPVGSDPAVGTLALTSTGVKTCTGTASAANFRLCWP